MCIPARCSRTCEGYIYPSKKLLGIVYVYPCKIFKDIMKDIFILARNYSGLLKKIKNDYVTIMFCICQCENNRKNL
jgi:hypothetical protein